MRLGIFAERHNDRIGGKASHGSNLSADEHERMRGTSELLHTLAKAEEDVRAGRVAPIEESFRDIRKSLEP